MRNDDVVIWVGVMLDVFVYGHLVWGIASSIVSKFNSWRCRRVTKKIRKILRDNSIPLKITHTTYPKVEMVLNGPWDNSVFCYLRKSRYWEFRPSYAFGGYEEYMEFAMTGQGTNDTENFQKIVTRWKMVSAHRL